MAPWAATLILKTEVQNSLYWMLIICNETLAVVKWIVCDETLAVLKWIICDETLAVLKWIVCDEKLSVLKWIVCDETLALLKWITPTLYVRFSKSYRKRLQLLTAPMEHNYWSLRYTIKPTSIFKWVRQCITFSAIWNRPHLHKITFKDPLLYPKLHSHLSLELRSFVSFPAKPHTNISSLPCMLHASPNSSPFIWWVQSTKHLAVGCPPSCSQFLAVQPKHCPQYTLITHPQSISFPPREMSTERHTNSVFCMFCSFSFYVSDETTRDSAVNGKEKYLKKISTFIPWV
jgi:hypothetical protein